MVERQDIDALLVSALYGELTPAEEARLKAHLESHPTDRTALDDLTRTREKLHESRILAYQYEPPQSVSALLMQEASRRAPKKAPEGEGWFARFVRSFVQHPGLAAAAMIVVVVGASTLVSRTGNKFAETPAVETTKLDESSSSVAMETSAPAVAAPAPDPTPVGGADQYKVDLASDLDPARKQPLEEKNQANAQGSTQQALPEADPSAAFYDSRSKADEKLKSKVDGLELRRREAMPKDLGDDVSIAKSESAKSESKDGDLAKRRGEEQERLAKPPSEPAAVAATPTSAPEEVNTRVGQAGYVAEGRASSTRALGGAAPAPTTPSKGTAAPGPRTTTAPGTAAPPPPAAPKPKPVARPEPTPRQEIASDGGGEAWRDAQRSKENKPTDKAANKVTNDPNLAWAKDQHAALVTAVRANNCGRAANIALSIANRAPAYYAQNVETDRSVKECIAYMKQELEKEAEVRASRAKKSQLKNAEPAAPKRAADQPSRTTTTTDSK